jgi:hypothetical protein
MNVFRKDTQRKKSILMIIFLCSISFCSRCAAFVKNTGTIKSVQQQSNRFRHPSTQLSVAESSGFFKGGLLADEDSQERAAELASRKLRTISDLGWKGKEAKRQSNIRPKLWAFGGSSELAIQEKANYSPDNPNCPDPWLGLEDFYSLVNDDTAAADLIFVSLAGGRAFVERNSAAAVLDRWWGTSDALKDGTRNPRRNQKQQFDRLAFEQTVKAGQRDFIAGWSSFLGLTGFAATGIVFPTNPLQLALVDFVDRIL